MAITLQTTKVAAQEFIIGSNNNVIATTVVIPVTCKNFLQFPGWQGSINWDNTKLTHASVTTVATQLSGASYNASISGTTGRLSFFWTDNNTNPQTIADNVVLFNITFNVVPSAIGSTDISFTNTPTELLLSNASFDAVSGVTYTKGTVNIVGVLPLTLTTFTATPQNNTVFTQWQTTNEVNVSHINVQSSIDGSSFSTMGTVKAKGGGNYSYTDAALPVGVTKLYYRLESVDKDGSKQYSKIVSCLLPVGNKVLSIYPNPVKETLFAQVTATKTEKVILQIADMQGKILQQQSTELQVGYNTLNLNTTNLVKGSYILLVKGEQLLQKQFIKE
jgi:hypothetical protein